MGKILVTTELDDKRVYSDFKQTNYLAKGGGADHDEDAEGGFCLSAAMYWVRRCMAQDAASVKGLTKYRQALDDLKTDVERVKDRQTRAHAEKAEVVEALRRLETAIRDLNDDSRLQMQSMDAMRIEMEQIAANVKRSGLTPAIEARVAEIKRLTLAARTQAQSNSATIRTQSAASTALFNRHNPDLGHGATLSDAYVRVGDDLGLRLHSGNKGALAPGFGSTVTGQIPLATYFIYFLEKKGGNGHAVGGYRSDGAGWGPFSGTSYLTLFDPNMGVFRCKFVAQGATFIERLHRAYVEDDLKTPSYPLWKILRVSAV